MAARIDLTLDCADARLCILKVPEPKTAKNRLHIDVRVPVRPRLVILAYESGLVQPGG